MNSTRRLMAILLSVVMLLSSTPLDVLAEALSGEEHDHTGAYEVAPVTSLVDPSTCEHASVEWSDSTNIRLDYLNDPAYNEPYSESKHLYTGPVTRSGFCLNCETSLTRDEAITEAYYASHNFGLDGLCSVCGHDPACDHANANWFDKDPSASDAATPDYYQQLSDTQHLYVGPTIQVGICPDCDCQANRAVESTSISGSHCYGDDGRTCTLCGYEAACSHPGLYMVNWDASVEDLGLAKNYVQKDAEHHTYIGPATLDMYCDDCGLHTQEAVESASIDMSHDLAITTVCGYCGYDSKPAATATADPEPTATATPAPTATVSPDATPLPDPTQQPENPEGCKHENAEAIVWFTDHSGIYGDYEYIAHGDGTHTYAGPGAIRYECADCGETFDVSYDEIRYTEDCSQDQYGICDTCDYDYSCDHKNAVISESELLTESGAHSFTDTSDRAHTYSGPANVTYSCDACHSAWTVHCDEYTAEFAHSYGDDSICDSCGHEIACEHADSKAIRVLEGNGSYARAYWNTHTYTGSGTILYECRDCGGSYTVTSDSHEKVLMDCDFLHDLYCRYCDADKNCLHKSGDYTLTPVDGSFAPLADGENHRFTGNFIFALVTCDECGAFDETLSIKNGYYDEPHSFEGGVCSVCGHACEHENAAWSEEIVPDPSASGAFTFADGRTHDYTGPAAKVGECPDCGEIIYDALDETAALTGLAHVYEGDVCTLCGYENVCAHGELYTVEGENTVVKCEPLDDGYTHEKTVSRKIYTRCADCDVLLGTRTVTETFNEMHPASGCDECGYVCPHIYSHSETVYNGSEFYYRSKSEHLFIGTMEVTETCLHCGETVHHYVREDYTCYLPHNLDADNVCTDCGYESTCEHVFTERSIYRDPAYKGQSVPVDAAYDLYASPAVEYAWCDLCGFCSATATEPLNEQFEHEFVGGVCIWCNYERTCVHPEEAIERTYTPASTNCKCEYLDDSHHVFVSGTYLLEGVCTRCGDAVLNRYVIADHILARHVSRADGKCLYCNTENQCTHIGHGIMPEFDSERADEFVYAIVSESAHSVTGPARLSGVCSGCGEVLDEEGVFTIEESHFYGADGICTLCSYFSGCAHPELLRYEISVPTENGSFAPAGDGESHIFTGVCNLETWCASCGLMISCEPGESGSFEFSHTFENGVCTGCGIEGSCDHENTQQWIDTELTGEAEYRTNLYHSTVGSRYRVTACTDCGETLERKLIQANIAINEPHIDNGYNCCVLCGGRFVCTHADAADQISIDYDGAEFALYDEIHHSIKGNLVRTTYCPDCRTTLSEAEIIASSCTMLEVHIFDENHVCMLCGYDSGYACTHENLYTERELIPAWSEPLNDEQHTSCGYMYVMELCMDCGALVRYEMEGSMVQQAQNHSYSGGVCTECYHEGGCAHDAWENVRYEQPLQVSGIRDSHHTLYVGSFTARQCLDCGEEFNVLMESVSVQKEEHLFEEDYYCSVCYYYGSIPATAVSVGSKLTMGAGTTHRLNPTVKPANATDEITYSSSRTSVATVDEDGVITAKKAGTATITVRCGAKSAKVTVTVKKAPGSIKLTPAKGTLGVGQTGQLKYTLSSGSAGTVTFFSNNPEIATVDENGKVTAVGVGATTIIAVTQNNKSAYTSITVKPAPEKITLSETSLTLGEKQTAALKASVNEGSLGTITFQSLNPAVATVSSGGVITAKKVGTTSIVARAQNGVAASCTVTVKPGPSCVTVQEDQLILGVKQTHKIDYVLGVENEDCAGSVTFSSSKPKVASVDAGGKITALRTGTTVITLTTQNDQTARVTVTVKKAPSSIKLSPTSATLGVGDSGTLKYTLTSNSAAAVQFTSGDETIATVDENGVITAVSVGTVTITARTHNGKKATCKLIVKEAPTSIALSKTEMILGVQQTAVLSGSVNEGSVGKVNFESLNPEFAAISGGTITAKAVGTATIRAWTYNGVEAFCTVTVKPAPSCITATENQLILGVKQTHRIDYVLGAENEDCAGSVTFTSSKPKVASVDASGKITALRTGTTVITLTTQNDRTARVTVTVKKAPSSIKLSPTSATLGVGDSGTLKYTLTKNSAAEVKFTSGNTNIATVDENGVITAVSVGTVTITARTHNGRKATCKLTVKAAPTSITLNKTEMMLTYGESFDLNHTLSENSHSTVRYSISGDPGITVDAAGVMKVTEMCPTERRAVVTASTHVEGVTAQCVITVPADPTEVYITSVPELGVKMTGYLTAATDTAGSITFHCDANDYFTLAADGKITAKKAGTAMVYAKTFNGVISEPVAVTISPAPSKVVIPATLTLGIGETYRFSPEFGSDNEIGTFSFKTSSSARASIGADGLLTAKKAGSVTITVTTHNGKKDACKVTIKKAPASVTLNKTSVIVGVGETASLKGSVNSGAGGVVKFETADTSLISVTESGKITGAAIGTATVRGYTYNGAEAFCTVEVVPAAATLSMPETMLLGLGELSALDLAVTDADGQPYEGDVGVKFSTSGIVSYSDGKLVALKKGTATLTVTAGNLSAACAITVKVYNEVHTAIAVAHRGGKNYWPENTLEAFTNMTSTGADMVEIDVQTTKDGLQVLNHDLYLSIGDQKFYISDYTYEELLAMKPNMCTLDQALEVISATGMTLQLELKDGATSTKCVDAIRQYGMEDRTLYISFNTAKLQEVRDYEPDAKLGLCFSSMPENLMSTVKTLDLDVLFPRYSLITESRLLSWHKAGLDVGAWTLNTAELIRKFLKMGVDYITSDSPDLIVKEIAKL